MMIPISNYGSRKSAFELPVPDMAVSHSQQVSVVVDEPLLVAAGNDQH
jgi:hypothetical protein